MHKVILTLLITSSYSPANEIAKPMNSVHLATRSIALEFCACSYLMQRDHKFCMDYVFEGIPLPRIMFGLKHQQKNKSITVYSRLSLGLINNSVQFVNKSCVIVP